MRPPSRTPQEIELQELQLASLRREEQRDRLMEPLIYEQMGYRKVSHAGAMKLDNQIIDLRTQLDSLMEDSLSKNSEAINDIQEQIERLAEQRSQRVYSEEGFFLEKILEEEDEITKLLKERQLATLKGLLPISPALESALGNKKTALEESLSRRLGTDYGQSTAGIKSLAEFDQYAETVREEARRGQIATGENLIATRLGSQASIAQNSLQNYMGFGGTPSSQSYLNAMQPFQEQRQAEYQASAANASNAAYRASGNLQAGVSAFSTLAMFAALYSPQQAPATQPTQGHYV